MKMRNYKVKEYRRSRPTDIRKLLLVASVDRAGAFVQHKGVDVFVYAGSYEGMGEFIREIDRRWRALKRKQPEMVKEALVDEAESILLGGKG